MILMKSFPRKISLLCGAGLAACAFVVPSMASASSWATVGTTHQLFSGNLSFTSTVLGSEHFGWSCAATEFHVDVASASALEIAGAAFQNCSGVAAATGCTVTATGTRFPWTATAPTTTNIQIHGFHVDLRFVTKPPAGSTSCVFFPDFPDFTWTGTLTGGSWDPSATGANRRMTFAGASGLGIHHSFFGTAPVIVNGTFRDTAGTLDLIM